jgi:hypothetical protein
MATGGFALGVRALAVACALGLTGAAASAHAATQDYPPNP